MSHRATLYSIAQTDADLAAVFSKWCAGTTEHRVHYDSAHTKISANSGVDQGCLLSTCGFSATIDSILRSVMADICRLLDPGAKLFAFLDDWYVWTNLSACYKHLLSSQLQPDQSTLSSSPPKLPLVRNSKTKSHSHSVAGWTSTIHGDTEPSPVVLGEQTTMEKTTQRFSENCHHTSKPQR